MIELPELLDMNTGSLSECLLGARGLVNGERLLKGDKPMKKREKDILEDPLSHRPVSKETARLKYDHLTVENEAEHGVPFENPVEAKIKRAMACGEFDNLPGKGRPIDLHDYCNVPEHLRIGYQMLKDSGYLPEEVRLKKEMESIKEKIQHSSSEEEKQQLMKALAETSRQFHFHMEYNRKFKKSLF